MSDRKVAVVEPRWWGHHPAFTTEICKCLMSLGAEVLCLCPDGKSVAKYLRQYFDQEEIAERFAYATLKYPVSLTNEGKTNRLSLLPKYSCLYARHFSSKVKIS